MIPKTNFAHCITMVALTDSMQSFSLRCLSPPTLIKQKQCQVTIIDPVLLARNYDYSAHQLNTKRVLHIFKLTVTTISLEINAGDILPLMSLHQDPVDCCPANQGYCDWIILTSGHPCQYQFSFFRLLCFIHGIIIFLFSGTIFHALDRMPNDLKIWSM